MKLGPFWRKKYSLFLRRVKKATGFVDYALWLFLDPAKFKRVDNKKIKKVLISLMHNGETNVGTDFVILGIANYVKKLNPQKKFVFILDKKTKNLFGDVPNIDFWEYNPSKKKEILQRIKNEKFDAALFFDRDRFKMTEFLDIPYRISYVDTDPRTLLSSRNKFFITRKINNYWGLHMVDFVFQMFESLGFKFRKKELIFSHSKRSEKNVDAFLRNNKIKKFIVLHPGGKGVIETLQKKKWPGTLWPLDRYAAVADHFTKKGFKVLIGGSPQESVLAEEINKKSKHGVLNICNDLNLRQTATLLRKAELLISPDSGIVHLAYQVDCPILELFGPSDYTIAGAWPLDKKIHAFLIDDGPCHLSNRKKECPEDIVCLDRITVKDVLREAEKIISLKSF